MTKFGKTHNYLIGYAIRFFSSLSFQLPIWSFFFTDYVGFTFAESALVASMGLLTSLIFEVPSGTWADRWGKKKIMRVGYVMTLICTSTYLRASTFEVFFINELIRGIGQAMISGCLVPIIYDRYVSKNKKAEFDVYSRSSQMVLFGARVIACLSAGCMFAVSPVLPYVGMIVSQVCVLVLIWVLQEVFIEEDSMDIQFSSTRGYIKDGWRYLRDASEGRVWIAMCLYCGGFFFPTILRRVFQPFFQEIGFEISGIGYLFAIGSLLSLLGAYVVKKIYVGGFPKYVLVRYFCVQMLSGCLLLVLPSIWKVLALIPLQVTFGRYRPVMNSYINHEIPSSHRATVNSLHSLFNSLMGFTGSAIAGYVLGWIDFDGVFLCVIGGGAALLFALHCFRGRIDRREEIQ